MFSSPTFSVIGLRPDGDQQLIELHLFLVAVGKCGGEAHAVGVLANIFSLGAGFDADAGFLEEPFQFLRNLLVFHRHQTRQHFENGHLRPETIEDRSKLNAHCAGADDPNALGNGLHIQNLNVGEDQVVIRLQTREHARIGAGGENDVLCFNGLRTFVAGHFNTAAAQQTSMALDQVHLVLAEQKLDALGVFGDDLILAIEHPGVIQLRVFAGDALGFGMFEVLPHVGGMEKSFGGNAAHQKAGSAESRLLLNESCLQAILAGPHGSRISTRAAADYNNVVSHFHCRL